VPQYPLGEVIAERELQLRKADGSESAIRVRIGRSHPSGDDWQCPYEIAALGSKRSMAIYGVDSIQALTLTLKAINVELEVIAKQAAGSLLWLGEPFTSLQDPADLKRSGGPRT
jgi:hypothetical protein